MTEDKRIATFIAFFILTTLRYKWEDLKINKDERVFIKDAVYKGNPFETVKNFI